jgi:hypothetical protein
MERLHGKPPVQEDDFLNLKTDVGEKDFQPVIAAPPSTIKPFSL